jgi:hypothetical protein
MNTNRGIKNYKMNSNISVNRWSHQVIRVLLYNRETAITLIMCLDLQQVKPHRLLLLSTDTHLAPITTRVKNN